MRRLRERMDRELARRCGAAPAPSDTTSAGATDSATLAAATPDTLGGAGLAGWMAADTRTAAGRPLGGRVQIVPRQGRISVNEIAFVREEEHERVAAYLDSLAAGTGVIPGDVEWRWGSDVSTDPASGARIRYLYLLSARPELTGELLEDARPQPDTGSNIAGNFLVSFDLDRQGRRLFSRTTGENVGKLMAIVLDDRVKSAPEIHEKIRGGTASITGSFSAQEAADLAIVLRAGALPVPLRIEEQRAVGPSLGRDSIELGSQAVLYGFVAVLAFMVVYYRVAGTIAVVALFLNLVLMLAVFVGLDAVLTLPGIAGFALTVGMSVDANVLIYERIREERRLGQTFRNAVSRGYSRAFTTILDSNVTTLFGALALLWFGTGPIKGFAVTLSLGIVVSMFTALYVTRVIFDLLLRRAGVREIPV
jgi:preprotein translocase subunit SecD